MAHPPRPLIVLTLVAGCLLVSPAPVSASGSALSLTDAKRAAVMKVERLERKLRDTGAEASRVPGCWRETRRAVGCLGIVRGADELVRWRCAVPMTVRRRTASASSTGRSLAVEFTDTMCSF